jgi:mono/diheme cytochrome c family protein
MAEEKKMATKNRRMVAMGGVTIAVAAMLLLPTTASADDAAAQLYKTKCAACHGPDGKGETPMGKANKLQDLASADVQKQSDADLATLITAGKNKMPAYGKSLSADQIKSLVGFVRGLAKK